MKYISIPWARTAPTTFTFGKSGGKSAGFFAWILESLHYSRRLQAQRFLRTNRHLIADSWDSNLEPNTGDDGDTR